MKWFEGGIPQAIQAAKQNNSVFIVFIAGEDAKSTEMESRLHSPEVTGIVETNRCVAIKIMGNSDECKFFSQIYPVVLIPSTFFIGHTGVPLEVLGETGTPEEFLAKVKGAIEMQTKPSTTPTDSAPGPSQPPQASKESQNQNTAEDAPPLEEQDQASSSSAPLLASAAEASGSGDELPAEKKAKVEEDLNSKVERAKELLEQKRQDKLQKEADEEKRKEQERRSMGQGVQKLREQQKEREMMEAKLELKKEREADKLARERVKEQIARDRAERAARYNQEKEEKDQAKEEARKRKLLEEQASRQDETARRNETARLQFRKPDGSSVNKQFPATATFDEVYTYIAREMDGPVTLSMTFPRRTFTIEDQSRTLQELELVPSAAILVIPRNMSTSGVRGSHSVLSVSSLTGYILAPVFFVWNMIASLLGLNGGSSSQSGSQPPPASSRGAGTALGGDRNRGSAVRRPGAGSSYQEGSIRRFHNSQDDQDPDDNSTWNGNSTQQM